jgi:pimeloyl-ACP methyl ester carboxylesterase
MLPSFLSPLAAIAKHPGFAVQNAIFQHKKPLGQAHCLWWPPKDGSQPPEIALLFVPGNPGLVEFYTPFLSALHDKDASSRLAILAHAHLNHTPLPSSHLNAADHSLTAQVQSAIEAFDALRSEFGNNTKLILVGHSVGSWISTQVSNALYRR